MAEGETRPAPGKGAGFWIRRSVWAALLLAAAGYGLSRVPKSFWRHFWPRASSLPGIDMLSRDDWQARAPSGTLEPMGAPQKITVHHSGGKPAQDLDSSASGRALKAIQLNHQIKRHWSDIAYHYVVDRAGRIWEGRSIDYAGAHAGSRAANERNIGILLLGNFDLEEASAAQLEGLTRLLAALAKRHGIARAKIFGHNEVRHDGGLGPTSCPGKMLSRWLDRFRREGAVGAAVFREAGPAGLK